MSGYHFLTLGESQTTTLRELIALIAKNLGVNARTKSLPLQPGDVTLTLADITEARTLGYAPTTPIENCIEKFVKWWIEENRVAAQ
jgi:UDP-glucuronate 4-epimerase